MLNIKDFDILIIGAGHAGIEAANIAAQFDLQVGLVTLKDVQIASTPCNPAIGGVGKGQLVRELDALGGIMPIIADKSGIQYRTLNESKGYAVQSTRVQVDKNLYPKNAVTELKKFQNISFIFGSAKHITKNENLFHVELLKGESLSAKKIIVTTGTFLSGVLHTGKKQQLGGRIGKNASLGLKDIFSNVSKLPKKFKTGTPPRVLLNSVRYNDLESQKSDDLVENFHFNSPAGRYQNQISCYLTRTNEKTLKIIRDAKDDSPMFNGQISGVGPRYCPSIEDKAYRYPDRDIHAIFLEPESLDGETFYPNGVSTSLPEHIQQKFIRTIMGLEQAEIKIPGYAVEYDVVDTTFLDLSLEHIDNPGLFFAGQVNGTSGYEEAAAQGFVCGLNAALGVLNREKIKFSRKDSYIGVLIEDLISNKRDEPYRLFTARSENRLYLREDNSIERMNPYRTRFQLKKEVDLFNESYLEELHILENICKNYKFKKESIDFKCSYGPMPHNGIELSELLKRPNLDPYLVLREFLQEKNLDFSKKVIKTCAINIKYDGYIARIKRQNQKMKKQLQMKVDWQRLIESKNISFECRARIKEIRPLTFAELVNIKGIRPATLSVVAGNLYLCIL